MDNTSIIFVLFVRAGFAFTAVVLFVSFLTVPRLRPSLGPLSRVANGLACFYALCTAMIGVVSIIRAFTRDNAFGGSALWLFLADPLLPLVAVVVLFLTVRRRPEWLLLPFAFLINSSLVRGVTATDQLLVQLWLVKPYVLLLMGLLFLLLVYVVYLLGIWLRRVQQEPK